MIPTPCNLAAFLRGLCPFLHFCYACDIASPACVLDRCPPFSSKAVAMSCRSTLLCEDDHISATCLLEGFKVDVVIAHLQCSSRRACCRLSCDNEDCRGKCHVQAATCINWRSRGAPISCLCASHCMVQPVLKSGCSTSPLRLHGVWGGGRLRFLAKAEATRLRHMTCWGSENTRAACVRDVLHMSHVRAEPC